MIHSGKPQGPTPQLQVAEGALDMGPAALVVPKGCTTSLQLALGAWAGALMSALGQRNSGG